LSFLGNSEAGEPGGLVRGLERTALYVPTGNLVATPLALALAYQDVFVRHDNVKLHGWWIPRAGASATLIFFHGNGGNISHRLLKIKLFQQLGVNILIFDYQGYGQSQGSPSEEGLYRDAQAVYDYAISQGVSPKKIILYGESLGCAVAVELAARVPSAALVLENPFTSVFDVAKEMFPEVLAEAIVRSKYDSIHKIDRLTTPVLIMSGLEDEVVPFEQGTRLFDEANEPKEFIELHGGHNESLVKNWSGIYPAIKDFLSKYVTK